MLEYYCGPVGNGSVAGVWDRGTAWSTAEHFVVIRLQTFGVIQPNTVLYDAYNAPEREDKDKCSNTIEREVFGVLLAFFVVCADNKKADRIPDE